MEPSSIILACDEKATSGYAWALAILSSFANITLTDAPAQHHSLMHVHNITLADTRDTVRLV